MNLKDAIKSGANFRRQGQKEWIPNRQSQYFTSEEIMAEDWEIESQSVSLSNHDYILAIRPIVKMHPHLENLLWELGQNLGFRRK